MTEPAHLSEQERADLVAYLDGELSGEAARAMEAKISLNPAIRAEADALRRAWELRGRPIGLRIWSSAEGSDSTTTIWRRTAGWKRSPRSIPRRRLRPAPLQVVCPALAVCRAQLPAAPAR